jgi:hypothetical protein
MFDRIIRAIKLDPTLYREVAKSENLLSESVIVVIIVAVVSGIGSLAGSSRPLTAFIMDLFNNLIFGWLLWSLVAYFVGTAFFDGKSSINEMLRAIGYANAPRLLGLFGFIPCVGWIIVLIGAIFSLIAGVIAIREAMEFDTDKAIITAIVGFVLYAISASAIRIVFSGLSLPFLANF